jgi:hypothetical protein
MSIGAEKAASSHFEGSIDSRDCVNRFPAALIIFVAFIACVTLSLVYVFIFSRITGLVDDSVASAAIPALAIAISFVTCAAIRASAIRNYDVPTLAADKGTNGTQRPRLPLISGFIVGGCFLGSAIGIPRIMSAPVTSLWEYPTVVILLIASLGAAFALVCLAKLLQGVTVYRNSQQVRIDSNLMKFTCGAFACAVVLITFLKQSFTESVITSEQKIVGSGIQLMARKFQGYTIAEFANLATAKSTPQALKAKSESTSIEEPTRIGHFVGRMSEVDFKIGWIDKTYFPRVSKQEEELAVITPALIERSSESETFEIIKINGEKMKVKFDASADNPAVSFTLKGGDRLKIQSRILVVDVQNSKLPIVVNNTEFPIAYLSDNKIRQILPGLIEAK